MYSIKRAFLYYFLICSIHAMADSFEACFKQAGHLFGKELYREAAAMYKQAIDLQESSPQAWFNLGICFCELKEYDSAIIALKRATTLYPSYAKAYTKLGKIAKLQKNNDEAIAYYKESLELNMKQKDALFDLVELLKETLCIKEAITYLEKALPYFPNDITVEFNLANTYNMGGRTQEALRLYLKISERCPHDAGLIYNIAYTYKKLGMMKECLPYYEKALTLNPTHSEARFSQGLAHLVLGDFEQGWEGYEYRWHRDDNIKLRSYTQPQWNGIDDLDDKIIFVYAEQGLGDTFQFIRYIRELKKRGAYVIFAAQNPLVDILKLCPYIDEVIPHREAPSYFDYQIPLVSLPHIFKTRIDTVPTDIPYLYADPELVEYWRKELAHDINFRIGICWQGNNQYSTAFLRAAVAEKSMPVALFEPLTHIPGVTVYSLQHITGTDQLNTLPSTMMLHTFDGDFDKSHGRFCDTAAVIKNLDLVITIDTSICHLAAGLGAPVWNLLPNPPDWRWMLERTDTPWYPNMRLFRQPTPGDWQSSINAVVLELKRLICPDQIDATNTYPIAEPEVIQTDVVRTSGIKELPAAHVASWGCVLDTLAAHYATYDTTTDSNVQRYESETITTLEKFAAPILNSLPLVRDYLRTLRIIHTRSRTEKDTDVRALFDQVKQLTIEKIDLLTHI